MSALPTSWADIELSEVAQVTSGIGFPNEYQGHTSGDLPFFKVSDISFAVLAHRGELRVANHYVSHEVAEKLKGKPLAPGSTVFAKIGEAVRLNRRATVTTPCLIDNNVMAVKAREGVDDRYVHQFLRTIDFGESARSTTVPSLRKGDVEGLRFPLAPIAEQKRIADKLDTVLTRVDAVNTRLARVAPLLKRFRQSVLAAATSGRLTEDWRGGAAMDYPKQPMSELAEMRLGKMLDKAKNTGLLVRYLRNVNVRWFSFDLSDLAELRIESHEREGLTIQNGDLLICEGGEPGRCANWEGGKTELIFQKALHRVRVHKQKLLPRWAAYVLKSLCESGEITQLFTGSTIKHLTGTALAKVEIPLPSLEEQTEIVRRVETLLAFADRLEARLAQAQTAATRLTPALLAKAFRGELVPQDPNDEPAAELLRRLTQATSATVVGKRVRKSSAAFATT